MHGNLISPESHSYLHALSNPFPFPPMCIHHPFSFTTLHYSQWSSPYPSPCIYIHLPTQHIHILIPPPDLSAFPFYPYSIRGNMDDVLIHGVPGGMFSVPYDMAGMSFHDAAVSQPAPIEGIDYCPCKRATWSAGNDCWVRICTHLWSSRDMKWPLRW